MRWASCVDDSPELLPALATCVAGLERALDGQAPDLLLAFFSPHHLEQAERITETLRARFPEATLLGCSGGGVVGGGRELERRPALSLTAAVLPDVALCPFHLGHRLPETPEAWHDRVGALPAHEPCFLLLPDPFTTDAEALVAALDEAWPGAPKVGGLVSGGPSAGAHRLLLDDAVHRAGAVGLALYGDVVMDTAVAQGARPIGAPLRVDRCERNLVFELDGAPAPEAIDALFASLDPAAQRRFRRAPMVGLAMDPALRSPRPGDFLVRNLIGLDRRAGVLAVAALVEEGQLLQFHERDPAASRADLQAVLARACAGQTDHRGALMFSCLGRGELFYGGPDHDVGVFAEALGPLPLGGFFCNGELGPVHGRTWMHGYTSSFGIFRARGWS
ncbi:MAG: FIST C-terminal domain-containing protein [Alphaproteobacteria bacterium]|nr:FIST C-terminal domain-containing protein [Alphaproteobacteria bacterium]